ncbi:MAG: 50S ribosomal protein L6 [Bacteroidetes bacterium]|nr:50S ribosomal protein L6 [Bacteroidota bacterium]
MSRVGKLPINIPADVTINIDNDNVVHVSGKLGDLSQKVHKDIKVEIKDNHLFVTRPSDEKEQRAMHGLYRALINNMVVGVSEGFTLKQELVGVGYKAEAKEQVLELSLGYSHDIHFQIPPQVKVEAKTERRSNPVITLTSHNKQLLGQVAAKIRSFRPPEPYKGKGIKFVGEQIRRKAGKAASV